MLTMTIPISESLEDELFQNLQSKGFMCLEQAIDPEFLAACRAQVDQMLIENGNRYFSIIQPQTKIGGAIAKMASAPGFVDLLRNLSRRGHSEKAVEEFELYNVLRIIAGEDATKTAFEFHYDATVLTVLMPLFIPDGPPDRAGDLIIMPNRRGFRRSVLMNIGEKAILQNPLAFRWYRHRYGSGNRNVARLQPGNLYFFWGYRTFHGNLPCEAGAKRATLLFHFGDPHAGDPITNIVLKIRKFREERRLAAS